MLVVKFLILTISLHGSLAALPKRALYGRRTIDTDIAPLSIPSPRSPYKQTSRQAILARRAEKEKRKHVKRQAQPSATVYPSCSSVSGKANLPQTGFADLSPYYIRRVSPYDVTGAWRSVQSALECITLCQQAGSSCTAVYYSPTAGTCSQRTDGPPPGDSAVWATLTGGTMALRGSCQQIAGVVNNATIMANCCDNTPPASTVCANTAYQNLGQNCARSQYSLGNNTLSPSTVTANTPSQGYTNCISACQSASSTAYSQQAAKGQCLGAVFDSTPGSTGGDTNPNCILQRSNLQAITTTPDSTVVAFMSGRCEEQNASSGSYSTAILSVQGCDTDPPLAFTS